MKIQEANKRIGAAVEAKELQPAEAERKAERSTNARRRAEAQAVQEQCTKEWTSETRGNQRDAAYEASTTRDTSVLTARAARTANAARKRREQGENQKRKQKGELIAIQSQPVLSVSTAVEAASFQFRHFR
jgi:hypothetical protein